MYGIVDYGRMMLDNARTSAYADALAAVVTPRSIVLDLGAGTGFFSLLACRLGARRVYAIESEDAIELGREIAAANGYGDRIVFVHANSIDALLPEQADVIVSDLRGILPHFGNHIGTIADARERWLAPGGVLIPQSDELWVACVEAEHLHSSIFEPWSTQPFGIDMGAATRFLANQWHRARFEPGDLVSQPERAALIDYSVVSDSRLDCAVELVAQRRRMAHGFCAWFDASLYGDARFSNAPGSGKLVYANAFFPWPQPVQLEAGDSVKARLRTRPIAGNHVWCWDTDIHRSAEPAVPGHRFRQSEFFGQPISRKELKKRSAEHVPTLGADGRIAILALGMMADGTCLGDIAKRLASEFPGSFKSWQDALKRVSALSATYSA